MTLVPPSQQALTYAGVYWFAEQVFYGYGLFEYSNADWADMRRGFEDMIESHPNGRNQNALAYFSCLAGDAAKLREVLPLVESHREQPPIDIWKSHELWQACVEFARSAPVETNPTSETSPEQDPT
jgi:hypothetical protein